MDATVDDFFNEINEIAPRAIPKVPKHKESNNSVWQECYDELTGYSYYWNTKTDEVTWTTPAEYKSVKEQKKEKGSLKKKNLFVPPRAAPLFPSTSAKVEDSVKIYSIGDNSKNSSKLKNTPDKNVTERRKPQKRLYKKSSDSEDEKIELISSFGYESDSDVEEPANKISNNVGNRKLSDSNVSDEDDDLDILTKIQKRAKELKELGGDIPPEVTNIVKKPKTESNKSINTIMKEKKKAIAGFSLVAGYSDSEEEQENEEIKSIFPVAPEVPKVSHSRLFPITQPIDVKDFMQPATIENKPASPTNEFDTKVFQRKRRIGVALINTGKKKEEVPNDPENERKGFGFSTQDSNVNPKDNVYTGFKKGGVIFIKSDILNPSLPKDEVTNNSNDEKKIEETNSIKREEIEDMYATIKEKLGFLSEGRPTVSPVQVMVIQAETLFMAMKDGALKLLYLQKWLNETCSDLIKLEKEAAPEGWLLQWDRSNKRYYYQNQITAESQWEYPQPDISRCDEAMDISTTPPPIEPTIHMSPPLPPIIRSPTPPPPPIISVECDSSTTNNTLPDVPLPPEPAAPVKFVDNGEPLPPGVDLPEIISYTKPKEKETKPADPLYSALDSFYSDIAAIENTNSTSPPPLPQPVEEIKTVMEIPTESTKKKKKAKVKLAPGLSMKKKGVSQLVEKWKTVQQHYND